MKKALWLALAVCVLASQARAGKVGTPLEVKVYAHLTLAFVPPAVTVSCDAKPGTVIATLVPTGGNGKPITYTITRGDSKDFAISGANVVVATAGITAANCKTSQSAGFIVTVSAQQ